MKCAPAARALEISVCTRVLEAVLTRVGGKVEDDVHAARACFRAVVKVAAMEEWTRIRSVAMQIWPDWEEPHIRYCIDRHDTQS